MTAESEISLGPLKLKGKDAFTYLGWVVAVIAMAYAAWGPPNSIREEQRTQSLSIQAITLDMAVVKSDVSLIKSSLGPVLAKRRNERELASR